MTEIPIVVSDDVVTVGGYTNQVELQLSVGATGERGSRIFTGSVDPTTLPTDSPIWGGYTDFKSGDIYLQRDTDLLAVWEWLYVSGEYTWVRTVNDIGGAGGSVILDADLDAIADLTGTGLARRTAPNTWTLDTATYLTSNQTITLSGVVTGSGTTAITTSFATSPAFTGTPTAPTAAVDTNTTQIATTAYVVGQGYLKSSTASSTYAPLASPTFTGTVTAATLDLTTAATATAATSYWVETGSDGILRPKTLANTRTEIVTTAAVNAAAATTVGTITSGTWQGTAINATYIDSAIARLASPSFTGTVTSAGNIEFSTVADHYIKFNSSMSWQYYLKGENNDFRIYDSDTTDFIRLYYNSGTTTKTASILGKFIVGVNGDISIVNGTPSTLRALKGSVYGYSSSYKALVLGESTTTNQVTVAIGVDPSGITSGAGWSGDGREVLFRNAVEFMTPDAVGTGTIKPLKFSSTGNTTVLGLTATSVTTSTITPPSGYLALNYGGGGFDAVRTGQLQVLRDGVGDWNTLFAAYGTAAEVAADTPRFIVYGRGAFEATYEGKVYGAGSAYLKIDGGAGSERQVQFQTAGSLRWTFGATPNAETGSNAGSSFSIARYSDAGAWIDNPFDIGRSDGVVNVKSLWVKTGGKIDNLPTPTASTEAASKGYVDTQLALKAPISSPTFTGVVSLSGVSTPVLKFENGVSLSAKNSSGTDEQFLWPRWTDNVMYLNYGAAGWSIRNSGSTVKIFIDNAGQTTFYNSIIAPAATTSIPSIRIPHGTAPSSPTNGDIWTTTTSFMARLNGTSVNLLGTQGSTYVTIDDEQVMRVMGV